MSIEIWITIIVFFFTMIVIFWRPRGLNEAWPAAIGAGIILITGLVSKPDVMDIISKIGGASITILATIVMAVILESFGFFHWSAAKLANLAKGSGRRLYWYIQLLCFLMTLLFNNDGSILITTPILILLLKNLQLKPHQQIPYLLSGALIATASSAPIGVSNIVNLIALNIVNMTLYMHTAMMFVPATLGLLFMSWLMYTVLKKKLPERLPVSSYDIEEIFFTKNFHPLKGKNSVDTKQKRTKFMLKVLGFVFLMRCLLFVASFLSIPIEIVAVLGSLVLLIWRWYYLRTNPVDILKKTPWHILIFAFSMYVIIYGLHNAGLTAALVNWLEPLVSQHLLYASFAMGGLVSLLSNVFNNHPALMIGTITLTEMGLDPVTLKTIYLANIIGSDIGSLLLPIGTLASLIWMYILKQNKIKIKWKDYLSVSLIVIPLTTVVTLFLLYYWVHLFFAL
ncbi:MULTISPECIES: arsenic transporter [Bacillus]|uniref:Arsenic transporter n=2 Tax=Bacillus cereus group TaxID=86661 RepID=A0A2A7DG55_BACAN|nr:MULTISPECIES: arsenic transporter [Bacillus]MCP1166306.1 arsenic transporter [Bacillus sp. 1813sda1]MDC7974532.1 arsenic transporter [Bacillus sp. BLCC-B18]OTW69433.1 arsenic transporter [Bacillus thuringiensis serovar coreanensis]OTX45631.1 arsenic transporter [Bacillus thuringiensis serovar sooncheon]OTX48756.1 arsenic transporter [Bacillus thuringiensis serovar guiyangiensis]